MAVDWRVSPLSSQKSVELLVTSHKYLVGGFNPSEKYESQLGLLFPIYGKIKFMFQTTNQISMDFIIVSISYVPWHSLPQCRGHHPPSLPPDLSLWKNMGKSKKWRRTTWFSQRNFSLEEMGRVKSEASNYKYWASVGGKHSILEVREFNPDPTTLEVVSRGASIQH